MCGACLADPPPFDACVVGCDYAFPWDRLIADFKFNARVELAAPLAQRLRTAIDQTLNVDKVRTGDLGGSANTAAFTNALVARIRNGG